MKAPRSSPRQQQVVYELRERIISGSLKPGDVLEQRTELATRFDVSGITIQRAVNQLVDEGHVHAIPGKGTYVTPYPPHAHRYGIVLPLDRIPAEWHRQAGWSQFWTALSHVAERISSSGNLRMTVYYGINGHVDVPDYLRLKADIASCRLAGLILPSFRFLMQKMEIPPFRVPTISLVGEEPAVTLDMVSFFKGALDELRRRGRKRVAVLLPHKFTMRNVTLESVFEQAGFELPPWHQQYVWAWGNMENIRNAVQLLLRGPADERPDGLIIADDNLVTYATVGIMASGFVVPRDLDVVAYANFPLPTLSHVPALRRGFEVSTVLLEAVKMATRIRAGLAGPADVLIPAINETELEPGNEFENKSAVSLEMQ